MPSTLSIPEVAEEIFKTVEQSVPPATFAAPQQREHLKSRLVDILSERARRFAENEFKVEQTFQRLAQEWRAETAQLSSMTKLVMHPKYQSIIGLGPSVVPILLRELRLNPDHWFWALQALTGEDPTQPEDAGDLEKMTESWLKWAEEKGGY